MTYTIDRLAEFTVRADQSDLSGPVLPTLKRNVLEGSPTRPMSWDRMVDKLHWLGEPFAAPDLRAEIIDAVDRLDEIAVAELARLLGAVSPEAQRPRTRGRL